MSTTSAVSAALVKDGTPSSAAAAAKRAARRRTALVWAGRIGLAAFVIGGWQAFTTWGIVDPFFFGQPSGIAKRLVDLFQHGTEFGSFYSNIWTTIQEALAGFALGAVAGVIFGVALGQSRFLADVLGPYIKVVNAIPRIVLGSIFIVAFGIGVLPKILLAAVLVFFIVFFNAFQGVREVDRNILANAKVLGASQAQIIRHVTVPSALTWIIASLHSAFGFAIVGALVGEVLGAQSGLGLVIKTAQNQFDPNGVFATMLVISVIVLGAEWLISKLEHRLLSWRPPAPTEANSL
ncbi:MULTISPECIES: ABC transporter permease [Streptomyces]|jgi:NitT/TauT family transport system permease protein|uniref:ABC transporter permease n=1 Tax=Streptomyces olivochromogenes TaxID=1963 RepID=A0A250VCQ7_STROL|nr:MULTISPECIES: ABC transporter permease [Streptomyces]KPI19420.1 ABC-type transporter, integral membrane subunit [Actinobacteria bacterium OK006]KAF5992242.1 ABC transporter permease [Streptomyces sp. WAC00263]KUN44695.1 ABC transporter permease [Streptomyces olivochromogenes]MCX4428025.1 ABC transporter permease [Streptomyces mirabilis]MCZ1004552.1 ABC transporter permease [Streptomyces mirabilis]